MKYPLGHNTWDLKEKEPIKVLNSGFFTMGKKVKEFEKNLPENLRLNMPQW